MTIMSQSYILAVLGYAHAPFTSKFKGRLFAWTLWIYLPNLKFVALRVPEIIGNILKIWEVPGHANAPFSKIFNGLLFAWTLWIYLPNMNFVAFRVPEIIGGTGKFWAIPGCSPAPFSPQFLKGFCSDGPCEYTCQIWSLQLYAFLR